MTHGAAREYDTIIVGGGPAGLSAALVLGRCRRRVLVCDAGRPRNAASLAVHGFLTRDGTPPLELLQLGRAELQPYDVEFLRIEVTGASHTGTHFELICEEGSRLRARTLLLATGVIDRLPGIPGIDALYGRSVHHCPYCDAWEVRDQPLAAYGRGKAGFGLALSLKTWSDDVVLCTGGASGLGRRARDELSDYGIPLFEQRIARLEGDGGHLQRVVFETGETLARSALFFSTGQQLRSPLALQLGCALTRKGTVSTGRLEQAHIPGLYVAGDASRDVQFVVVAAAEGAKAGYAINKALQEAERRRRGADRRAAGAV
jgi:thioredoxin reductase